MVNLCDKVTGLKNEKKGVGLKVRPVYGGGHHCEVPPAKCEHHLSRLIRSLDEIEAGLGKVCVATIGGELIPRDHLKNHGKCKISVKNVKLPGFSWLLARHFST